MKKVLIAIMSCWLISSAVASDFRADLPVKPRKQTSGLYFKVRTQKLKGPKAKNLQVWRDRAVRKPIETTSAKMNTRKGVKRISRKGP